MVAMLLINIYSPAIANHSATNVIVLSNSQAYSTGML